MKRVLFIADYEDDSHVSILFSGLRDRVVVFQYTRVTSYDDAGRQLHDEKYSAALIPTLSVDGRGFARDFLAKAKDQGIRVFIGTGPEKLVGQARDLGFDCLDGKLLDELVGFLES